MSMANVGILFSKDTDLVSEAERLALACRRLYHTNCRAEVSVSMYLSKSYQEPQKGGVRSLGTC